MILLLTVATLLVLGHEVVFRIPFRSPLTFAEKWSAAVTVAFAVWISTLWAFALTGLLNAEALAARNVAVAVVALVLWWTRWRARQTSAGRRSAWLLALAPVVIWTAAMAWRGTVIPPLSHDALSHHLPKAVFYARLGAYDPLPQFAGRARHVPVNYELLLSELLIMEGNDGRTEWPSLLFYAALILGAVALSQSWWGEAAGPDVVVGLLVAAVPVMLLHSGAIKNDLMVGAFMVLALIWMGRYVATGERASLWLLAATLVMATGTKPQAAMLAAAAAPFVILRAVRDRIGAKALLAFATFCAACVLLLGGGYWLVDYLSAGPAPSPGAADSPFAYGDWQNVLYVPWVLLTAPFASSSKQLTFPWAEEPWFWRRYEIYFSELGVAFALCALALPVAILLFRREAAPASDRRAVSIASLLTFLMMLPVTFRPLGMYAISMPRYVLFVVPVVFAWTVAPYLRFRANEKAVKVAVVSAGLLFVTYAVLNATNDAFVPPRYVRWAASHPGTRVIPFEPRRVAAIVDRVAGPEDAIAIEAADAAWIHPLFGSELTRPVTLIPFGETNPRIGSDIRWIVFDRTFSAVWKHPKFTRLGQAGRYLARGEETLDADPLFRRLKARGDFELVHYRQRLGQAVFRRRAE